MNLAWLCGVGAGESGSRRPPQGEGRVGDPCAVPTLLICRRLQSDHARKGRPARLGRPQLPQLLPIVGSRNRGFASCPAARRLSKGVASGAKALLVRSRPRRTSGRPRPPCCWRFRSRDGLRSRPIREPSARYLPRTPTPFSLRLRQETRAPAPGQLLETISIRAPALEPPCSWGQTDHRPESAGEQAHRQERIGTATAYSRSPAAFRASAWSKYSRTRITRPSANSARVANGSAGGASLA
jgi:hypothetical protein